DAILSAHEARPAPEPVASQRLQEALELAGDDAARQKLTEIHPENIFVGLMRCGVSIFAQVFMRCGTDRATLRGELDGRLFDADDRIDREKLMFDADARSVIE